MGLIDKQIKYLILIFTVLTLNIIHAQEGVLLGGLRESYSKKTPSQGWSYLWNVDGKIGDSKSYKPLIWNNGRYTAAKSYPDKNSDAGYLFYSGGYCHPGRAAAQAVDGNEHAVIFAYKAPRDFTGDVWIVNGNVLRVKGGNGKKTVSVKVLINDNEVYSNLVEGTGIPVLFNTKIGKVLKGDMIYVALGPDDKDGLDGTHIDYQIKEFPKGDKPKAPRSTIKKPTNIPSVKTLLNGKPEPGFINRHNYFLNKISKVNPELVFIGDSITAGWEKAGRDVWNNNFKQFTAFNLGISGDRVEHVLWRIKNNEIDNLNTKIIVLLIGTNNTGIYTAEEILTGQKVLLQTIKQKQPQSKIIVLGVLPRGKNPNTTVRRKIETINEGLKKYAAENKLIYIDLKRDLTNPDGTINKEIMPDYLHPSKKGYDIIALKLLPVIKELMGSKQD